MVSERVSFPAAVLLAPEVDRRFAHAVPLGNLGHHIPVRLSQAPDDLLIAVSHLLHLSQVTVDRKSPVRSATSAGDRKDKLRYTLAKLPAASDYSQLQPT